MKKQNCEKCGKKIPSERLKILPNTKTCVKCSEETPKSIRDLEIVVVVDSE